MGLPMVALAKLSLAGAAAHQGLTPLVTALVLPFVLKFCFSFRPLHDTCSDVMHAMRLFVFQMGEIAFGREPTGAGDVRWQRALRLVCERVRRARHARPSASGEESLVALSMLSL